MLPSRRQLLTGSLAALAFAPACRAKMVDPATDSFQAIESRVGGRVGVFALTNEGRSLSHRSNERFAMCSTFKWVLAACVLEMSERNELTLTEPLSYSQADLHADSPVTREHVNEGKMRIDALCEAAVTRSDNTAANLLLERIGGPKRLRRFMIMHGDSTTRLDRTEPELNQNSPGDPRDTTTPRAMAGLLRSVVFGDNGLSRVNDARLDNWLRACKTGKKRLRAGLPSHWILGHKTGTGYRGAAGDVGVAYRPEGAPIIVAAYLSDSDASFSELEDAIAAIGRIVARQL